MNDGVKQRGLAYAKYLSGLSPEERGRINERNRKQGEEEHKEFLEQFQAGQCWICGDALSAFDPAKPCPHWLLKPNGFGKEHFELITQKYSLIKLEHYLRWVANEEAFAKNINDLADEGSGKLCRAHDQIQEAAMVILVQRKRSQRARRWRRTLETAPLAFSNVRR